MKKELYNYAKPNLPNENVCPFNFLHIFAISLFSLLTLFWGNTTFSVIVFSVYLSFSLLTYIDKDIISRYLKLILLSVVCVYVCGIYIFEHQYPRAHIALQSFFYSLAFFAIYETSVIIKIKKRAYSNKSNDKKSSFISTILIVFLFTFLFKILNRNQSMPYLVVALLTFIGSIALLGAFILIQKNVVYLFVKNQSGSN